MIENTSKRDPFVHLLGAMSEGSSDYITGMESEGQRQLVASEQLPTRAPIADLEALGFTFGPVDERDPLFRPATLPDGWKREPSDHAMWSHIVDDKGRRRVAIFYKAAFYDRAAHAHLVRPTSQLDDLLYAAELPDRIDLDELLTADVARDWVVRVRAAEKETLSWVAADSATARDVCDRLAVVARVEELIEQASRTR